VTDANVVLGRLDPDNFLGGEMRLNLAAAQGAVERLAREIRLDPMATAEGILTIVNSNMANAIRSRTVQKGLDPRDFSLVAFGGGGPMQVADVAAMLSIPEVIVPHHPGITSAIGLLTTDLKYDAIRTAFQVSGAIDHARIDQAFKEMEASLADQFAADGISPMGSRSSGRPISAMSGKAMSCASRSPPAGSMRTLSATCSPPSSSVTASSTATCFPTAPRRSSMYASPGSVRRPRSAACRRRPAAHSSKALVRTGSCMFRVDETLRTFETAFYRRDLLPVEEKIAGPAVILQHDSTTVVRPVDVFRVDRSGNIIIAIAC
jgi:N-methylhydantoinase A